MDTFVDSSWYQLRYCDNRNPNEIFDGYKVNAWCPVDLYVGGIDHATGHLIYVRFFTKFLHDLGLLDFDEPATKLFNLGWVKDEHGRKMSKSRGNVVSPMEIMAERGVDNTRLAMFFFSPSEKEVLWNDKTMTGVERFTQRFHRTVGEAAACPESADYVELLNMSELPANQRDIYILLNQTIKQVGEDLPRMQFNTCIAALMEFHGKLTAADLPADGFLKYVLCRSVQLLAPMAPHLAEECWEMLGNQKSVFDSSWPEYDPEALKFDLVTVAVQVNGKVRGQIEIDRSLDEESVKQVALAHENVARHLEGKQIVKFIYVKEKLASIVAK
jgi:leucyl-tRNA synthetase